MPLVSAMPAGFESDQRPARGHAASPQPAAQATASAPFAPSPAPAARPSAERTKLGSLEIGRIADRVYRLLVDRLAQERQRRGV